jgi:hypothetical protein
LVANHDSNRIRKFDKDWNWVEDLPVTYGPISLSATNENNIFVTGDDGIHKYDSQFNKLDSYLNSSIALSYVFYDESSNNTIELHIQAN